VKRGDGQWSGGLAEARSIIQPLRPSGADWRGPFVVSLGVSDGYPCQMWEYDVRSGFSFRVLSAVEVATDKDGKSNGPEYHLSMSRQSFNFNGTPMGPRRCSSVDAAWILEQFRLDGAEEDNHVEGGIARNFWRPVAEPLIGRDCECKSSEPRIIENRGDFIIRP
jgi:hypothetical protein